MEFLHALETPEFWLGLGTIIWVNIILSGDNAVVIALALSSLIATWASQRGGTIKLQSR